MFELLTILALHVGLSNSIENSGLKLYNLISLLDNKAWRLLTFIFEEPLIEKGTK